MPAHPHPVYRRIHPMIAHEESALVDCIADLAEPVLVTRADLASPGPTIVAASRGLEMLTQYPAAELIGRNPRLFQGPLTDRAVLDRLRRSCELGERFVGEAVNYRRDGSPYMVQWTIDPLHNDHGRTTHFLSIQQDVTAQHQFAEEWLATEARLQAALSQVSQQMALISETILVLEKTKRSFRSKELGALRTQLVGASRSIGRPAASRDTEAALSEKKNTTTTKAVAMAADSVS